MEIGRTSVPRVLQAMGTLGSFSYRFEPAAFRCDLYEAAIGLVLKNRGSKENRRIGIPNRGNLQKTALWIDELFPRDQELSGHPLTRSTVRTVDDYRVLIQLQRGLTLVDRQRSDFHAWGQLEAYRRARSRRLIPLPFAYHSQFTAVDGIL